MMNLICESLDTFECSVDATGEGTDLCQRCGRQRVEHLVFTPEEEAEFSAVEKAVADGIQKLIKELADRFGWTEGDMVLEVYYYLEVQRKAGWDKMRPLVEAWIKGESLPEDPDVEVEKLAENLTSIKPKLIKE